MALTLYNADLSPFASRVRLQIRAKGLENEFLMKPRLEGDAFRQISPTGKVPCLDVGAYQLPESETICEFIEDSYPDPSLRGHTALGKAKVRLASRLVDLYLMPGFTLLFGQMGAKPRDGALVEEGLRKVDDALGIIEPLLEGRRYALENRLTLADCALVPAFFFCAAIHPGFGKEAFNGRVKAKAYYETLTNEDDQCARIIGEMADGLKAMMSRRA
jgi:glutathione S-transferase